jgi:hypothetical protein
MGPAVRGKDIEFCILTESGALEAQALLLCDSIRTLAGAYSSSAIVAVSPRPSRRPCPATLRELDRMGVEYLELDVHSACPDYGTTFRIHALAHLSRRPGPGILVQIDSDTLFVDEPDFSLQGVDVAARPVDVKGMCTTGEGDPFDQYWRNLCALCEVDYARLPDVVTTVDRKTVRANYNGGLVVAKRNSGIFERTEEFFLKLAAANARPFAGTGMRVKSGVEIVSLQGSEYWGSGQAALSLAVTSRGSSVQILPPSYNVPLHLFDALAPSGAPPIHVHYHWLCSAEAYSTNPMLDGRLPLPADTIRWLRDRMPLGQPVALA